MWILCTGSLGANESSAIGLYPASKPFSSVSVLLYVVLQLVIGQASPAELSAKLLASAASGLLIGHCCWIQGQSMFSCFAFCGWIVFVVLILWPVYF